MDFGLFTLSICTKQQDLGPFYTTPEKYENGSFTLKTHQMFFVHTTPEEFENEGFPLKTHQMFFVHTKPEKLENATITGGRHAIVHPRACA